MIDEADFNRLSNCMLNPCTFLFFFLTYLHNLNNCVFAGRFQLQLSKEQKLSTECDTKSPFSGHKDILRRLAVFHVFQTRDDDAEQIDKGDINFTCTGCM